jgi:two-component system, LytTR family, sensor kinase
LVLLFASQWYLYDATRQAAEPFRYYLGWSAYMWGVLTPLAVRLARRWPLDKDAWKRNLPRHVAASVLLTGAQLFVEGSFGWWRHGDLSFRAALRHYFTQHTQISVLTYWVLVGGMKVRALYDQSRKRALRSSQLETKLAHARLDALRGQLQPHFLFNTLQAATTLIYEDPEGAEEILLSLSELLRFSLEELSDQEVTLAHETRFLEYYMVIQQRRFGDRLKFEVEISEDLRQFAVPSLMLQPLVENAIRHGIGLHKGGDVVSVAAHRDGERLRLEIRNRNSTLHGSTEQLLSRGVGLANTAARLEQLYGREQSCKIRNLEPRGVEVVLSLPARPLAAEALAPMAHEAV